MKQDDERAGLIASLLYNSNRPLGATVLTAADFFPRLKPPEKPVTVDQQRMSAEAWAAAGYGTITNGMQA